MHLPITGEWYEERAVPRCVAWGKDTDDSIRHIVRRSWDILETPMVTLKRVAELPVLRSLGASDGFKGMRRKVALGQDKVGLACRRVSEPSQLWADAEERCAIGAIAHGQGHGI